MRAALPVTPYRPGPLLAVQPPPAPLPVLPVAGDAASRAAIALRVAACRACPHVGHGASTCADCDLRCAHPAARAGEQLLARLASTCPDNRWPATA